MKKMEIHVDKDSIKRSIDMLGEDPEFFVIDRNLFTINKIVTIFKQYTNLNAAGKNSIIEFTYFDKVVSLDVKIIANFVSESCFDFVKSSKMINDAQLNAITEKTKACFKDNYDYDEDKLEDILDEIVLNESLTFLMTGVNKDDCENIKNDFTSKFEAWKARQKSTNEEISIRMETLFSNLMLAKVFKKTNI